MAAWDAVVEVLRESIFAYAQATHGNLGFGIVAVTFLARLALLPLTLKLARAAAAHQATVRRLQPELDAIRARSGADPARAVEETRRLYAREGVPMFPASGCLGSLAQAPILLALFSAVRACAERGGRFLWIRDLARPDRLLATLVAAVAAAAALAGPEANGQSRVVVLLPAVFTCVTLSYLASGVGLYWGVSSAVGVVQGVLVRRYLKSASA